MNLSSAEIAIIDGSSNAFVDSLHWLMDTATNTTVSIHFVPLSPTYEMSAFATQSDVGIPAGGWQ